MEIDPSYFITAAYLAITILFWLKPPRWIQKLGEDATKQIQELKQWAPRLVGSVKHGTTEEVADQAVESGGNLVGLLVTFAKLAPVINQLVPAIQSIAELAQNPDLQNMLGKLMASGSQLQEGQKEQPKSGWGG